MNDTLNIETSRSPEKTPIALGTKAETLARLQPLVTHSVIGTPIYFEATVWRQQRQRLTHSIRESLGGERVAVRSSCQVEDRVGGSNAGRFLSVIDVDVDDEAKLGAAIDAVIDSFDERSPNDQVLIQAVVHDVVLAGVAFTRSFNAGAPYYVISYDDQSGRTDTVTGGTATQPKFCVIHRLAAEVPGEAHPSIYRVLRAIRELEGLVGSDALDIEFAVDRQGVVHLLQVRAMTVKVEQPLLYEEARRCLAAAQSDFRGRQKAHPAVCGSRTIFGVMSDWNPAEMIGRTPRRLALSLYRYLITDDMCAAERAAMGYRDIRPNPLMVEFCGHPYIDLRASFSSFIPDTVADELANRLVEFYLTKLEERPEFHDKVEFEVALTALSFDIPQRSETLLEAGFGADDVAALRAGLLGVTEFAMSQIGAQRRRLAELEARFDRLTSGRPSSLARAIQLLQDCRRWGTPAFAQLARAAFIAVGFLRSSVARNVITPQEMEGFIGSLKSGAKQMSRDAARVRLGNLSWDGFVNTYGHLRPGTYDLAVPSYGEAPGVYLDPMVKSARAELFNDTRFEFSPAVLDAFGVVLRDLALPDDVESFVTFLRSAIEGREAAKFAFTRNLSRALADLAEVGTNYGLLRRQTAQIDLKYFIDWHNSDSPSDPHSWLTKRAAEGEKLHETAQAIELPPLIAREAQLLSSVYAPTLPNFVGRGQVLAPAVELAANGWQDSSVAGKIALLVSGDPGYDWLYGMGITGLVTLYGGVNSHMAIRAAELGIPAVLGVGEAIFNRCRGGRMLRIDCLTRHIEVVG